MATTVGYNGAVAIAFALCAAIANAFATILQRLGVEGTGRSLMASVLRRPVWFAGLGLTTASFLFQALALANGNLSTVQPVMVTEILFLVAILGIGFHRSLGWRDWIGASGTSAGLGVFLAVSASSGGNERPSRTDWILVIIASAGAIALGVLGSRRGPRAWRAACLGVAAGICFALTAACLKVASDQWVHGDGWHLFFHPESYGVAILGFLGLVLSQHALDAGPIAASQAALLTVNPLASIVMGIWLFDDRLHHGGWRTIVEVLALGTMMLALFVLSTSPLIADTRIEERLSGPAVA
jgi:drug/metabolite transporter (DMT)-like permease